MNTIDALKSINTGNTSASPTKKVQTLGQEEFLKLMTTQMTHQDPTKPMDNAQFLSQMAQFGTVSGIQELQQSFKDFSTSISSDQSLQAASLVGRNVSLSTNEAHLETSHDHTESNVINGTFIMPSASSQVTLQVLNAKGDVVKTQELGRHSAGIVDFSWDGSTDANDGKKAASGTYKIQVEALIGGVNTALKPDIQAKVESVSMGSNSSELKLNLSGYGPVQFNQIKQIN